MMDIIWVEFTDGSHSTGQSLFITEAIGIYIINAFKRHYGTHYFTVSCITNANE